MEQLFRQIEILKEAKADNDTIRIYVLSRLAISYNPLEKSESNNENYDLTGLSSLITHKDFKTTLEYLKLLQQRDITGCLKYVESVTPNIITIAHVLKSKKAEEWLHDRTMLKEDSFNIIQ